MSKKHEPDDYHFICPVCTFGTTVHAPDLKAAVAEAARQHDEHRKFFAQSDFLKCDAHSFTAVCPDASIIHVKINKS